MTILKQSLKLLSKKDRKRVELLKEVVVSYLAGKESLADLSFKIKALQQSIETLDAETLQKIFDNWGEIEIIYAFLLAEGKQVLTTEEEQQVIKYAKNVQHITEEI